MKTLTKAENPEAYKKLAEKGIMVAHPVKINGKSHRSDIGIGYHATVKFFNPEKDSPQDIHAIASKRNFVAPDANRTKIEPGMFKDRHGNDVYVIKLHGPDADKLKEHHQQFSHMGHSASYQFQPHVSVDKATWQKIVDSKATNAKEAGIEFGPAELRQGHKVLSTYSPKHDKLAASENMKKNEYEGHEILRAISHVENSGGKFANHRMLNGSENHKTFGKYGLTASVIRETVGLNRELKGKHSKAAKLDGADLHHYMQDNPDLDEDVAQKHLARIEHHFGKDPVAVSHAWVEGIAATRKAKKSEENIQEHWNVEKVKNALKGTT